MSTAITEPKAKNGFATRGLLIVSQSMNNIPAKTSGAIAAPINPGTRNRGPDAMMCVFAPYRYISRIQARVDNVKIFE